jgi:Flp pilus assembly protein CpaB
LKIKEFADKNKKTMGIVLATSAVWLGIIGSAVYLTGFVPSIGNKYIYTVKAAKNISAGKPISITDLKLVKDFNYNYVPTSYNNKQAIAGKTAQRNIYTNENIKQDDISSSNVKLWPCTLQVSLDNLSDPSINTGDYVDIILNYKEESKKPDIVVAKALVENVIDSSGETISKQKTSDQKQIPAHLTALVKNTDILYLNDAKKLGTFQFYKYPAQNLDASKATYKPSWTIPISDNTIDTKTKK